MGGLRGVAPVAHPAPEVGLPRGAQGNALQRGTDIAPAHVEAAGAEQVDGRPQGGLGQFDVLRSLLHPGGGNAQVGIVGHRLGDQGIELGVAEGGEPVVLDAHWSSAGRRLPRIRQGQVGQRAGLLVNLGPRGRRLGGAARQETGAQQSGQE